MIAVTMFTTLLLNKGHLLSRKEKKPTDLPDSRQGAAKKPEEPQKKTDRKLRAPLFLCGPLWPY